ncbi:helix-turn-helix domain-containing protein [Paraglaciecola aquimarina]|uniref:Helix-turn-helix domain-containing protein n=1 Tax=Paraglaciecola algarum TaxID=3050085 RepID=A0ABS9D3R1_9ALTE|nr:helix-turn-helix domain-containing protein [Paraglaciecola sp. G1-23]
MSANVSIHSLLLFLAAGQGIVFAILLCFRSRINRLVNMHLAFILLAFSVEILQKFLLDTGYIFQFPYLVGINLPFDATVGIALYWYVRSITYPEKDNSPYDFLKHYSVLFVCIVLSIPYWSLDFESKLLMMETGAVPSEWPAYISYSIGGQVLLKIVSFSAYLFLSIKMLLEHKNRIKDIFSYQEKITLMWLTNMLWLFLFGLLQGISILLFFQEYEELTQIMGFMEYFSIIVIFYIGVMGLLQPEIYRQSEQVYITELKRALNNPAASLPEEKNDDNIKYRKSALTDQDMQRIANKLNTLMQEQRTFLEPDLSMPQLAAHLTVSPNYLSQTLSSKFDSNFFDYINRLRIDYAKIQLLDPQLSKKSVVDIAIDSAFNSRSAFYTAFKKHVGMTPSEFKKNG